jgi:CheY-like chemotaxis protein
VANVSHELRTPLNMVIGFSETILDSPTLYGAPIPPALLADLAVIHRNAEHLSSLIDDVLDLNQMETGDMTLSKELVAYPQVVDAALTAVRPLFDSKNLYLYAEIAGDLPPIYCDPLRIREVLMNLLSNAGRFTEVGGVCVRVWLESGQLHTSVTDTGLGIAPDKLPNLFQPFYQVDSSIRRRFGGTGLGLSISKRFVELHAGKISVESCAGEGTTFSFRIPAAPPQTWPVHPRQKMVEGWEFYARTGPSTLPSAAQQPHYLVVDPSQTLARLLRRADLGGEVNAVRSLEEAVAALAAFPAQMLIANTPSLAATLDLLGGGLALPQGTPALFCTLAGNDGAGNDDAGSSSGLSVPLRLIKPVQRQALLDAVSRVGVARGVVLIVDDEPDALQLFGRILASAGEGFRILQARDGVEALAVMQSVLPDLIVMDLVMPNMDGFQLLEHRAQDPVLREIPVIVVSAQDTAHQPILANHLIVGRGGGLSAGHLLRAIQFTTQLLHQGAPTAGAAPPTAPHG